MQKQVWIVWTTLPDREAAERMAERLVAERLAACAQIDAPMRSIYHWQGNIERDDEVRLWLKTNEAKKARLLERIAALHPYQVPQVVAVPAEAATPYARWLDAVLAGDA